MVALITLCQAKWEWREDDYAIAPAQVLSDDDMIMLKTLRFYRDQKRMQDPVPGGCMNMASDDICNPKVAELQAEKTMQGAKKLDGKCTQNKALQRMCAKACNQCAP